MQSASERSLAGGDYQKRYIDIYDQALTFVHMRRGATFGRALASAMILAGFKYLQQYDTATFRNLAKHGLALANEGDKVA